MKLLELDPHFFQVEVKRELGTFVKPGIDPLRGNWTEDDFEEREHDAVYLVPVETLAEADGISFLHPGEFRANGGPAGTSTLHIPFNKPGSRYPGKVRWDVSGAGLEDLTIFPSILTRGHPDWHGWIRNGEVVDA